jgi:hypothetical protein
VSARGAGFGERELQLVLLRRMADFQPELVRTARHRLGASGEEMRLANQRWQAMLRSRRGWRGVSRYRQVLGEPAGEGLRRIGDLRARAVSWDLPLWPDLRFEVLEGPGGWVVHEWLVRAPGVAVPALRTVAELTPWSCVVGDVAIRFAPVRHLEGDAPSRWALLFLTPEAGGEPRRHLARFVWGLLQTVGPA